jgi:hypothetical protein
MSQLNKYEIEIDYVLFGGYIGRIVEYMEQELHIEGVSFE